MTQTQSSIDTTLLHLPECQMIQYNAISVPNFQIDNQCPQSVYEPIKFV